MYVCLLITELKVQKAEIERDNSIITDDFNISLFIPNRNRPKKKKRTQRI